MVQKIRPFLIFLLFSNLLMIDAFAFNFFGNKKKPSDAEYRVLPEEKISVQVKSNNHPTKAKSNSKKHEEAPNIKTKILELLLNSNRADYHEVLELLDSMDDINIPLPGSAYRALEVALARPNESHYVAVIHKLIDKQADVNMLTHEGSTPLMIALRYAPPADYFAAVKMLLDQRVEVNGASRGDWTPLMFALRHAPSADYLAVVKMLLDKEAEINGANREGWTSLMFALRHAPPADYFVVVKMLLDKEPEVVVASREGGTPLMLALRYAPVDLYAEILHLLLEKNADVGVVTKHKANALWYAYYMNRQDAFALLLLLGEDASACIFLIADELNLSQGQKEHYAHEMNQVANYIKTSLHQKELVSGFAGKTAKIVHKAAAQLFERHPRLAKESSELYPGIFSTVSQPEKNDCEKCDFFN